MGHVDGQLADRQMEMQLLDGETDVARGPNPSPAANLSHTKSTAHPLSQT